MTVTLDSGKLAEVSPEQSRHIDYGYAVDSLKGNRAERVIATGDGLTQPVSKDYQRKANKYFTPGCERPRRSSARQKKSPHPKSPSLPSSSMALASAFKPTTA